MSEQVQPFCEKPDGPQSQDACDVAAKAISGMNEVAAFASSEVVQGITPSRKDDPFGLSLVRAHAGSSMLDLMFGEGSPLADGGVQGLAERLVPEKERCLPCPLRAVCLPPDN
jgi:hypothetical protein